MGLWGRILAGIRRKPRALFNLAIAPGYAIKASASNPYFQGLERLAREGGFLGDFVVGTDGALRPGRLAGLPTREARIMLDVYPNPAAVEGRGVADFEDPSVQRRVPRATLILDDDSELLLWFEGRRARVAGAALGAERRT